jgi:fatty-acid peroxygenase
MIERTRKIDPDGHAVLNAVATFKESDGRLLTSKEASVELLNFLRPTVAVARFVVFAALAIEQNPDEYERLRSGDQEYLGWFIDEVRRLHPLIPFMAAYTKRDAEVLGHSVPDSTVVALDLFGTCRHPAIWGADADDFRPERFEEVPVNPFNFIPQGGGDVAAGHRCPGEDVAREILRASIQHLVEDITYRVPPQDLSVDLARIPMIPASRFVISDVRPAQNFL